MSKTIFCGRTGKQDAMIEDCMDCPHLCVDNPNLKQSGYSNSDFINQWGLKEIERCLEERRQNHKKDTRQIVDFEEICIIKIENINRELSPYQKCRLVEDVRRGEE